MSVDAAVNKSDVSALQIGRSFSSGETIYQQEEVPEDCYLIRAGQVRLVRDVRGRPRVIEVLRAGDLFGEEVLLNQDARVTSAVAMSELDVLVFQRGTFEQLIGDNPKIAVRLIRQLIRRLRHVGNRVENATLQDKPSRVVNTLLHAYSETPPSGKRNKIELSPVELAARSGVSLEDAAQVGHKLEEGGYLVLADEGVEIPDIELLRKLYELLGRRDDIQDSFA